MNDPLDPHRLRSLLAQRAAGRPEDFLGHRLELHRVVESTNDRARELSAAGEPEGMVVMAEEQTRGRGRSDRTWHSPRGLGLYLSAILRPEARPAESPLLGLMGAVAAAVALDRFAPGRIRIQWPNDLVAAAADGSRPLKLAGILAEARAAPDRIRDLVIGVGVNVNHGQDDFPPEIAGRAVSIAMLRGEPVERVAVAAEILTSMDGWYNLWRREGSPPILAAFRSLALDLEGRRVTVSGGEAPWEGTTAGLAEDGALRVVPAGQTRVVEVRYGEVLRVVEEEEV